MLQDQNSESACVNPLRADENATQAAPFFAPCQHAAWTYVNDGKADAWGACQSGHIVCCAGTTCPANPNQAGDPDNGNSTAPTPSSSGKEDDFGGAADSCQRRAVAAAAGTVLPGLASLSLPARPVSFSRPAFASLSLPVVTLNPSATRPAVPAFSLSLPAGVSLPAALQPAPTTASRA